MRTARLFVEYAVAFSGLVSLAGCGGGLPEPVTASVASFAPAESPSKTAYVRHLVPPPGFAAVVGWMQAIDIRATGQPQRVEVDWMRLHATVNGTDVILAEEDFSVSSPAMGNYGLYSRSPWFAGDRLAPMPFRIEQGSLVIEPNLAPNRVFHWWNTLRPRVPAGTTRVWFEARIRVTGGAGVQAGVDYWRDENAPYAGPNVNNTEAGASDWYGNSTPDWQIVSFARP